MISLSQRIFDFLKLRQLLLYSQVAHPVPFQLPVPWTSVDSGTCAKKVCNAFSVHVVAILRAVNTLVRVIEKFKSLLYREDLLSHEREDNKLRCKI